MIEDHQLKLLTPRLAERIASPTVRSAGSVTKKPAADRVHTPVGELTEDGEKHHTG